MTVIADRLRFGSAALSHAGCVRTLNEDSWLARDALAPGVGLWAVADGMGGHRAGEDASRYVVRELSTVLAPPTGHQGLQAVEGALQSANAAMRAHAATLGPTAVVGSTAVLLFTFEGHYACLWAGDSRCYLMREGRLKQLTRDDRLIQPLLDAGALTPEQARRHPQANVLTRALGAGPEATFSLVDGPIQPGDLFLLCSDGLTDVVEEDEIARALTRRPPGACAALLRQALDNGAPDNVTCVAVHATG